MNTEEILTGWERYLRVLRGVSSGSINIYGRKVNMFFAWLKENGRTCDINIEDITRRDIEAWLEQCYFSGNSNSTRNTKLIALRQLYRYLAYEGIVQRDITADIPAPKVRQTFVQKFNKAEILKFFEAVGIDSEKGIRDTVIFILGAFCGLRAGEIEKLRLSDIMDDGKSLNVNVIDSKHGSNRVVYLWKVPSQIIRKWTAIRITQEARADDILVVSYGKGDKLKGKRLNGPTLDFWIKNCAIKAGITRPKNGVKMHMLRATHICDLRHVKGYDLPAIAARVGHKHISTTERYIATWGRISGERPSLAAYWSEIVKVWTKREEGK